MNPDFIKNLETIRQEFVNKSIDKNLLTKIYQEYSCIADSDLFVEEALDIFPKLNCGLASVYLKHLNPRLMIVRGKYLQENHTFCLTPNNLVVDITADQYGGPQVYLGEFKIPWQVNAITTKWSIYFAISN